MLTGRNALGVEERAAYYLGLDLSVRPHPPHPTCAWRQQTRSHVLWQVAEDAGDPLADLGDDMLETLASRIEDGGGGS